jgi:uncharacterized protein (DUF342 family)
MAEPMTEKELLHIIREIDINPPEENISEKSSIVRFDGHNSGWVKIENNKIIITDPIDEGHWPTIEVTPPLVLTVNGQQIKNKTIVRSSDKIEWSVEEPPLYSITVEANKMEARFQLHSKNRYTWRLKSKPHKLHMVLEVEEDHDSLLETVQLTDVITTLRKMSIIKNIKTSAIFRELQNPTHKSIVIAHGYLPVPCENAKLELYFNEQVESQFSEVGGSVDFRNHRHIPSVKAGDIIARKTPPIEGQIGYDVYGEIVKPQSPKDIIAVAKDNVELLPNGDFIALKDGRPRMTGQAIKSLDVCTTYVVTGNVNLETGNIVFSGDVIVYGDVQDGMIIESLGNIYISGSVFHSDITATGSIHVQGNVIGSNLYSGYFGVIFNRLYMNTKKLGEQLNEMLEAVRMLLNIVETKGKSIPVGQAIMIIMENKFKEIPSVVQEIMNSILNIQSINTAELSELKNKLELLKSPLNLVLLDSLGPLQSLLNLIQRTFNTIELSQETRVFIDIKKCHLSKLKSNGNIMIRKEGCIQSDLYSKENIVFYNEHSVCRGSKLEAGQSIVTMIVGGETGGENILKATKRISVRKMFGGRIIIQRYNLEIVEMLENVTFYINDGKIVYE